VLAAFVPRQKKKSFWALRAKWQTDKAAAVQENIILCYELIKKL
jgi:hypothetical protein